MPSTLESIAKTIVPHANWRGTYGAGTYANGSTAGGLDLTTVRWPADDLGAYLAPTEPYAEDQPWIGGLIGNIRDANGWLYRRNRYYDPATGRFTQEDPIGLAGGLNLYAFGGGDAVSYADPYGLCSKHNGTEKSDTLRTEEAERLRCIARTRLAAGARDAVLERINAGLVRTAQDVEGAWAWVPFGENGPPIYFLTGTIMRRTEVTLALTLAHELQHTAQRSFREVQRFIDKGRYEIIRGPMGDGRRRVRAPCGRGP